MRFKGLMLGALALVAAGCAYFEDDGEHEPTKRKFVYVERDRHYDTVEYYSYMPSQLQGRARVCERVSSTYTYSYYHGHSEYSYYCYEDDRSAWHNSCQSASCREVPIYVHYMLSEELGDDRTIQVEAFDNGSFTGQPKATVEIHSFKARRGEWAETSLFLDPGEYYIRAYLTTRDETRVPYSFQGMELVAETPMGVYGVLSSPEILRVSPYDEAKPTHVMLDKLFREPGSEPPTNARLRLKLEIASLLDDPESVAPGHKVHVNLYESADLEQNPVYAFDMLSDLFLVQGRVGRAEFVSPSLELGAYVVFAFLDLDANGFHDAGEPSALYTQDSAPRAVMLEKDKTRTLEMRLATE